MTAHDSNSAHAAPKRGLPILVGGIAIALAENLPGFSLLDWACCGTIWSGALLAVYLASRQHGAEGIHFREAITIGMLAALIAAGLNLTIDFTFKKSFIESLRFFGDNPASLAETLNRYLQHAIFQRIPILKQSLFVAISLVVHLIVGAIGGMLGATLFPPRANKTQT
jgi:hypothetical protein